MSAFQKTNSEDAQRELNQYFHSRVSSWAEIYERDSVYDLIHQERLRIVLALIDQLRLLQRPPVLEVGCGAGYAAVALAKSGFDVVAIDPVGAMVEQTRERAERSGVGHKVRTSSGDVHALSFPDESFGLIIAMGVLPWLPSLEKPLQEMGRVLEPGGYLVVTVDHRWALHRLLDPLTNPILRPAKEVVKMVLKRSGDRPPGSNTHSIKQCDAMLQACGLDKVNGVTLGFGPFGFLRHELLPRSVGLRVHRALQGLAERRLPLVSSAGAQYIVLARKPVIAGGTT